MYDSLVLCCKHMKIHHLTRFHRQYKEALRQQRQQDVYRPRTEQSSPDLDSPLNQSPVHLPKSQSSPHSPINGYTSNTSPYNRTLSSNSSINSPNSQVPNSPLLHSTPRRIQSQNGNIEENKRPVQKVVPSRNVNKIYSSPNAVNGNVDYSNGRINGTDSYIKPTSPTKSPTMMYHSIKTKSVVNGGENARLLTTSVSYLKGNTC